MDANEMAEYKADWKPLCHKCEQNNMFSAEVYKLNKLIRCNFR